ncbi:MAG TPA: DinB family protein [Pirellulaceae bacterium]|nr:DinB family protein [Pirellulaceae bacterium]
MGQKERLRRQLVAVRQNSERLLADFRAPEEWTFQVHPSCNHALWFAGHMAISDNFFLSLVAPDRSQPSPEYQAKFGMGSQPTNQPEAYPAPEVVLQAMRERRQALLEALDRLSDADLARKTPAGAPDFLPDVASVFELAIWHEGQHSGQVTVARRVLGHKPLF